MMPGEERSFPRYGDICDMNLDPVVGSEIGKRRPALIVSNDINNEFAMTVTVLPITSQPAARHYPFEVVVPGGMAGLTQDSRIKADQVRTLDKRRIAGFRGQLPEAYLHQVQRALRVHLNME